MKERIELIIDNLALENNYDLIKKTTNNGTNNSPIVACCIKSNAYGFGMLKVASILRSKDENCWFCVQSLAEGIELRKAGFKNRILIISAIFSWEVYGVIEYSLTPIISTHKILNHFIQALSQDRGDRGDNREDEDSPFLVHLMFESGMNWLGMQDQSILEAVEICNQNRELLKLEGIATHFATSDAPEENGQAFFKRQLENFLSIKSKSLATYPDINYFHAANSGAIMNYTHSHLDIVQPGILLYGLFEDSYKKGFKLIGSLKTYITCIKKISKGEAVGYSNTFIAPRDSIIGTLPIGYYNGISRANSGQLVVIINDQKFPQVGNIGMNSMMIDLTSYDGNGNLIETVKDEDEVTVISTSECVNDMAKNCNTISYEIVTALRY
jgi:alanine racemase